MSVTMSLVPVRAQLLPRLYYLQYVEGGLFDHLG
jgi:hypothetical protein